MAVLKQTSPTAWPVEPRPMPSSTVPSASTKRAVAGGSVQPFMSCLAVISGLHSRPLRRRQSGQAAPNRAVGATGLGWHARLSARSGSQHLDAGWLAQPQGDGMIVMESTVTCPHCGHRAVERMPDDACRIAYDCKGCAA